MRPGLSPVPDHVVEGKVLDWGRLGELGGEQGVGDGQRVALAGSDRPLGRLELIRIGAGPDWVGHLQEDEYKGDNENEDELEGYKG